MPDPRIENGDEPILSTDGVGETLRNIVQQSLSRRDFLKSVIVASVAALGVQGLEVPAVGAFYPAGAAGRRPGVQNGDLSFEPIKPHTGDGTAVAANHVVSVVLRWGDAILPDAPEFDPENLSAEAQEKQFGYNCDFVGFLPLPAGSDTADHGLLVVNHEYTNPELMFEGWNFDDPNPTQDQVDIELAAHGLSVVEIQRDAAGQWTVVLDSPYNRRITATTPMSFTGPAAGNELLITSDDPTGTEVLGTLNNCAGGKTPWGTVLSAEENFNQYFSNAGLLPDTDPRKKMHSRYGIPQAASQKLWDQYYERFDVAQEPNEPFRYGWVVEVDPFDAGFVPRKRTALGRNKHEAATFALGAGGQAVFYSGDDERFEYVYKFVSEGVYQPDDREANLSLLDTGTLYVAKFNSDRTGEWLPLVQGQGGLTAANGFASQADVLIYTRGAADRLGATKMDRPEDIEFNTVNQKVYLVMTNNTARGTSSSQPGANAVNPRRVNRHGHILELTEAGDDPAATEFTWGIFMLCGEPLNKNYITYFAGYPKDKVSMISCPDNITFDMDGNLWIATDGQPDTLKVNDGIFVTPVAGTERGFLRQIFAGVSGGEVCGPEFNPDNTALFLAIQHPGEGGTFEDPVSIFPDNAPPPRPSVVVIQADGGARIGHA